jgi:lipoprotein-anchoring transpeptidase ErfK/SrfK
MEQRGWAPRALTAILLPVLLTLPACTIVRQPRTPLTRGHAGGTGTGTDPRGTTDTSSITGHGSTTLTVTPRTGATNQPVTTEIRTTGGTVTRITLTDSRGRSVPVQPRPDASGLQPRPDGVSWVPARQLDWGARYTATVTATGSGGEPTSRTVRFTTMTEPGPRRIRTGLYLTTGHVYGVGMPVAVEFSAPVPDGDRAAVERRLFVRSDPPQVGAWHWFGDRQVLYRPWVYWSPGTRLSVRAALGGLPVGGRFLDRDRSATVTIGRRQTFLVRNDTKSMYVYQDGRLTRTLPVSLGKRSTPTSSGNLVIMSHEYVAVFVTRLYRITAYYDERITWDGQFLHAAPWSEGSQGRRNVSHGCVNLPVRGAAWVYRIAQVGDPVTITGTEVHVLPGNGWTVWDLTWAEYLAGSALPHPGLESLTGPGDRTDRG